MKNYDFWKLTKKQLWKLRNEVDAYSIFCDDFANSYDIDNAFLCRFFDGYFDNLEKALKYDYHYTVRLCDLDNAENLYSYRTYFLNC